MLEAIGRQRLGLLLGAAAGALVTLAVVAVLVLVGSKDSKRNVPARPAPPRPVTYTLRPGDVVRDPLTATRCEASAEGGAPNLFCTRTTRGRYQVVFYSDAVLLFDLQKPNREPLKADYTFPWVTRKR